MSWDEIESEMVMDHLQIFGEPILLPGGVSATGRFNAGGGPEVRLGELSGLDSRLLQGPQPVLHLSATDGATLVEGDRITARGQGYLVSRIDPDGPGELRFELISAN